MALGLQERRLQQSTSALSLVKGSTCPGKSACAPASRQATLHLVTRRCISSLGAALVISRCISSPTLLSSRDAASRHSTLLLVTRRCFSSRCISSSTAASCHSASELSASTQHLQTLLPSRAAAFHHLPPHPVTPLCNSSHKRASGIARVSSSTTAGATCTRQAALHLVTQRCTS